MTLKDFFRENNKVAVAFSGGVDSAYLLSEAVKAGADVTAYYVKSAFQPAFEYDDALKIAEVTGARMITINADVLSERAVVSNPGNRCYFCKNLIFGSILKAAADDGYTLVLDGTNASDDASDRPGMKALAEMGVRSPLRECGLTKAEIRRLSREAGLFTWDKPSYACLATRVPTGVEITQEILTKTEAAEGFLSSLGFRDFRIRYFCGAAKIQLKDKDFGLFIEKRRTISAELKKHYTAVLLDTEER